MATTGITRYGPFHLRWTEEGSGPLVLLLHGIYAGAGAHEWDALVTELARDHRVRVPDLLGFGASDHPDLEYTPAVVLGAVEALIADADRGAAVATGGGTTVGDAAVGQGGGHPEAAGSPLAAVGEGRPGGAANRPAVVVASSLVGAYAVRALAGSVVAAGPPAAEVRRPLVLITPTGLGGAQARPSGSFGAGAYALARHTPVGDVLSGALTSRPSIRWFLRQQAYRDESLVTDDVVDAHHHSGRRPNAKHSALAFVFGRLALPLEPAEVAALAPVVLWAAGQSFSRDRDAERWAAAGARVERTGAGLPQAEEPAWVAAAIRAAADESPVASTGAEPAAVDGPGAEAPAGGAPS